MMKNKFAYLLVTIIAFMSQLSTAVQIVPLPVGAVVPKPRVDLKVMKEDALLQPAKSPGGAKARLNLATYRLQNAIGDDAVNLVEATAFLREVLVALPATKAVGAEARILLADLRRRELVRDDAREIATQLKQVIEAFAEHDLGIAARARLILFRTEGLIGNDILTLQELARLIDQVEGRHGVDAAFVTTARNAVERLEPARLQAETPPQIRAVDRLQANAPEALPLHQQDVQNELAADARNELALKRFNSLVDDTVITIHDAAYLLRQVIAAHGPITMVGARARVNLTAMFLVGQVNDRPLWLAQEMQLIANAFPANTLRGGGARLNLINLRLLGFVADEFISLDQVETMLGHIEEELPRPEYQPAVEDARAKLQAERAREQTALPAPAEVTWIFEPLPELFDLGDVLPPLPTLELRPIAVPPMLNVRPAVRAVVMAAGTSMGNIFGIAPADDASAPEPPQKRGRGRPKKKG